MAVAPDPVTAAMWQEALRRAGVPAMLRNRDPLSVAWGTMAAPFSASCSSTPPTSTRPRLILADIAVPEEA